MKENELDRSNPLVQKYLCYTLTLVRIITPMNTGQPETLNSKINNINLLATYSVRGTQSCGRLNNPRKRSLDSGFSPSSLQLESRQANRFEEVLSFGVKTSNTL